MKLKRILFIFLSLALLVTFVSLISYGNTPTVNVYVNGSPVIFDVPPVTVENRLLVPIRAVMETLGSDVSWDPSENIVTIINHDTIVTMPIDSTTVYKNQKPITIDVPVTIIDGRTLVPLRFISESLGAEVHWNQQNRTVYINQDEAHTLFSFRGITIGSSMEEVSQTLGNPKGIYVSEYAFDWYVYHEDYHHYIQLGILEDKVVAMYSNYPLWRNKYHINVGADKSTVNAALTHPLEGIIKGNTKYLFPDFSDGIEYEVFQLGDSYVTIFYDLHQGNSINSIKIVEKSVEENYLRHYNISPELKLAYERQVFELANAQRVREGLKPFLWCDVASSAATKHSRDMSDNNFFNHDNLKGETPFLRMKNEGIKYRSAGENLAAGQQNPIYAHEGWMNSLGHRKALLGDFTRLGVGVWFGDSNSSFNNYYTQKFYTP